MTLEKKLFVYFFHTFFLHSRDIGSWKEFTTPKFYCLGQIHLEEPPSVLVH